MDKNGKDIKFESFSESLQKWLSVYAYRPETNYFVTFFEYISGKKEADADLKRHHDNLEEMVKQCTLELEEKTNIKLDDAIKAFVGREITIQNLHERVKVLEENS